MNAKKKTEDENEDVTEPDNEPDTDAENVPEPDGPVHDVVCGRCGKEFADDELEIDCTHPRCPMLGLN